MILPLVPTLVPGLEPILIPPLVLPLLLLPSHKTPQTPFGSLTGDCGPVSTDIFGVVMIVEVFDMQAVHLSFQCHLSMRLKPLIERDDVATGMDTRSSHNSIVFPGMTFYT